MTAKLDTQVLSDKTAISLSALCAVHCLLLPLLVVLVPSTASLWFNNEAFHEWLLVAVLVCSSFAFCRGYLRHNKWSIILWGVCGIAFMLLAVLLGHDILGEYGEKSLTLIGATIVAIGHVKNYKTCQQQQCKC